DTNHCEYLRTHRLRRLMFYVEERSAGALRISHQLPCIAAFTLASIYGIERSRMPVASNTAFEIAEGMTEAAGSPAARGFSVGRSIRSMTISGTWGNLRIGTQPSSWFLRPSGLMI